MKSVLQSNLKIGYWNIEGLSLSGSCPKVSDQRFIKAVSDHDIFCLAETHCSADQNIEVNGYKCFKLSRSSNKKNNRCYGGIAVLYKSYIHEGIKFLEHHNNDYIWLKLNKSFFKTSEDIFMCIAYIPPESSAFYKKRGENTLNFI